MIDFDMNLHLPCEAKLLEERIIEDLSMNGQALCECFDLHSKQILSHSASGNFMLFNQLLDPEEAATFIGNVRSIIPEARFTHLVNLEPSKAPKRLAHMHEAGVDSIKFHCYQQQISQDIFTRVVNLAQQAAEVGMPIFIDTSYGSTKMYAYDNLRLSAAVIEVVSSVPIILLHSGGARAIEAMLLADSAPNVFLETSFSVPYYLGSTIEKDLAFAYKQIGAKRVAYGSDFPYVALDQSLCKTREFLDRNGFTESECNEIFGGTARRIFEWQKS